MTSVLIVDDSPTMRRMVKTSLDRLSGLKFREAGTGLEAIESLVVAPVDLIVLDLNMPDMHGLDVLKFVRAQEAFRALPIVVLTTLRDESSRRAALDAGATLFLTKPFEPESLSADIAALLGIGQRTQPATQAGEAT